MTTSNSTKSPAARALDEAIELKLRGRSPYPETCDFIDADAPHAGVLVARAADAGRAVALVSADGSTRVLHAETVTPAAHAR
jgi:hypothetical protein